MGLLDQPRSYQRQIKMGFDLSNHPGHQAWHNLNGIGCDAGDPPVDPEPARSRTAADAALRARLPGDRRLPGRLAGRVFPTRHAVDHRAKGPRLEDHPHRPDLRRPCPQAGRKFPRQRALRRGARPRAAAEEEEGIGAGFWTRPALETIAPATTSLSSRQGHRI